MSRVLVFALLAALSLGACAQPAAPTAPAQGAAKAAPANGKAAVQAAAGSPEAKVAQALA